MSGRESPDLLATRLRQIHQQVPLAESTRTNCTCVTHSDGSELYRTFAFKLTTIQIKINLIKPIDRNPYFDYG